ncbi:hypothetical protein CDL15_Pgr008460 [Punica granatum]|uniref:3-ketoacyl-CoA synthase n=1 Tax=Punica granatum TaxID=22663 RepID=A0A218WNT3_PUNGR|nr:hypothetical protein CDL15_Pgr008460 [Punica granatum]
MMLLDADMVLISGFLTKHVKELSTHILVSNMPYGFLTIVTLVVVFVTFFMRNGMMRRVYLVDFACYKPPESQLCTREFTVCRARTSGRFSEKTLDFMQATMDRSGLGDSTCLPEGLIREPLDICLEEALREARSVMFGAVREVLEKTGLKGSDIRILVVNCCVFCVAPSLSAMIVNEFKLRDDVMSYNLQGMGCSAGLAAVGLAKHLLQVHCNSYALVLSTENLTENVYQGDDRSMILINCLFRVGGAVALLSNRPSSRSTAKYELLHTVHTQTASSDRSYSCIFRKEDEEGGTGISITKDLLAVANQTIKTNIAALGHLVLPLSEKFPYAVNAMVRYFQVMEVQPYNPDFTKAIDHICPHVGGKPVLDELQKSLHLSDAHMEASRMTLYKFGNTSSSSVWYELAYIEAKGRMKRGDRVWQIAFGSGFKCHSAIWRVIRMCDPEERNPWSDEINSYPVDLSGVGSFPYFFEPSKQKITG